jgi:hypothetical protein
MEAELRQKVHAFMDRHVAGALAVTDPDAKSSERSTDQPQRYILIDEMAKEIRDPNTLRAEVLNVFFPARDTMGIALSNTFSTWPATPASGP